MPIVELRLLGLLTVGLGLAAFSLVRGRSWRRGILPVTTLVFLSTSALIAAAHRAETLIYLGLAAGGFVAALSWDGSRPWGVTERR